MNKEILAIIPARGGSKGIPKKNIQDVEGKPLIAYTIEEVKKSKLVTRIIVSTDSEEIAQVAKRYGAEVPFMRSKEMSENSIPLVPDLIKYVYQELLKRENYKPDVILILQPTSPLRKAEVIDKCINLLNKKDCGWVVSVSESNIHPFRTRFIDSEGKLSLVIHRKDAYAQRQELPNAYFFNGAVYATKPKTLDSGSSLYEQTWYGVIMPAEDSIDIDRIEDLELLRQIIKQKNLKIQK